MERVIAGRKRKIHKGPRGGMYYVSGGKKRPYRPSKK